MTTQYGVTTTDNAPHFKAEGEQQAIRYMPQQPQQQQQQQQQPYQGYPNTGMPVYGNTNQPMVAQAMPAQYPNYGPPNGQFAVQAVPISIVNPTRGMWSDGLCDCFNDCESCLLAWIIPPYLFGRTVKRSGLGEFGTSFALYFFPWLTMAVLWTLWSVGVVGPWSVIISSIAYIMCSIVGCMVRGRLRLKYAIPGDQMEDMCMHCCCVVCALSQESRHVARANSSANAPPVMPMQPLGVYAPQQQQQQFQPQQFQPQQFQPQQFQQQPVFAQAPVYPN